MNKIDLGAVSAYALAKEKGYQGTEEEFATLMMQSGDNALRAEAAANRADDILGSIPPEYTELSNQVSENTENVTALTEEIDSITAQSVNLLPIEENVISKNGIEQKYKDGILTVTGTASAAFARLEKVILLTLDAGEYTISIDHIPANSRGVYVVNETTQENLTYLATVDTLSKTFNLSEETRVTACLRIDAGNTVDDAVKVQLESGSVAHAWQAPSEHTAIDKTARAQIADILGDGTNPLHGIDKAPTFATMFNRIVHIGDSLTAGSFNITNVPGTVGVKIVDYSRPAQMAKMLGSENINLGFGSTTACDGDGGWWTALCASQTDLAEFNKPGDCYIIALGTNDITKLGGFTGTVSDDIGDATTSVGGYAAIIERIRTMQPKAKIFCVTIPHSRNSDKSAERNDANDKIRAIAALYGAYVIDLYSFAEQGNAGEFAEFYKNGSHNNALGYNLRARQYIAYIDWIIQNNLDDFRDVQFIGTEYDWTQE